MKRTHQTLLIDETEGELVLVYQLHYRICNLADFLQTTTLQCNNLKIKVANKQQGKYIFETNLLIPDLEKKTKKHKNNKNRIEE